MVDQKVRLAVVGPAAQAVQVMALGTKTISKYRRSFRIKPFALAYAIGLSLAGQASFSQDGSTETRQIIRSAGIAGVEPVSIDLNKTSTQRFALIIGNGNYENAPNLKNAVADSKLIAQTLRQSGYTVSAHYDLDKRGFETAMRGMLFKAELGAEILVYYSGHGVQIGGRNYILPTDSNVSSVYDLPFETVSLQGILALASSRARSVIAILDSCRDNPFPDKKLSADLDGVPASIRSGFNPQESPINSLIVFSTAPGSVALDGEGKNSPFTKAMVEAIVSRPEASFDDLLKDVRRDVYERTNRLQLPWQSSSLVEPVYLGLSSSVLSWDKKENIKGVGNATQNSTRLSISAALDPKIPIGTDLVEDLENPRSLKLVVVSNPASGQIEVLHDGQFVEVPENATLDAAQFEDIYYRPASGLGISSAKALNSIEDNFVVLLDDRPSRISISLDVNPCDLEAGDHLDPEGVGFAVYPNELEPSVALESCLTAVQAHPENGRFYYQLGRAHLALRDIEKAEAAYSRARNLGHTRAYQGQGLIEIAKIEETHGRLSGRASDRALGYFAAGVERGDPYAYHSLGLQFLLYPASENERLQGFELLSRALELGHTFSMNALGLYFLDEAEAHYNPQRGLSYLRGSAERDDIYGIANLGYVYSIGIGDVQKDSTRAKELFERAAAAGHPTAPTSLGRLYFSGDLQGGENAVEAVKWYDQGLARGDGWGGANAAWIIANRSPKGYSPFDAAVRAAKAATLRNQSAQNAALEVLAALPNAALDGGTQTLMRELGVAIEIDGNFGPNSTEKLNELARSKGVSISQDRQERLLALAKMFWEQSKFRVDLY